jgi:uncharacterized DUF497 family protein
MYNSVIDEVAMRFTWDPEKARRNLAKHGVAFEDAELVWHDPLMLIAYDRYEGGEHRFHAVGRAGAATILVVHTYPDEDDTTFVRIIGARRATRLERKSYEEG